MVHFIQSGPRRLFYSAPGCMPCGMRVTPFGHPRIDGYVLLPAASRGLSRPSSPPGSSGIHHGPILRLAILLPRPALPRGRSLFLFKPSPFPRPVKLRARPAISPGALQLLGQNRVELLTPALSERCSNQLSYCPFLYIEESSGRKAAASRPYTGRTYSLFPSALRKEVIQPHLPVRLPCYDFTPLTSHTLESGSHEWLACPLRVSPARMV